MKRRLASVACLAFSVATTFGQFSTTNLLINPGAETGDLTGWTKGGDSNPFAGNPSSGFSLGDQFATHSGTNYFVGGSGAYGSLSQQVSLVGNQGITAAAIDEGTMFASVSFWEQGLNQGQPSDNANITIAFLSGQSTLLGTNATPVIDSHNGAWQNYATLYSIPSGTRSIQYTMNFYRNVGSDLDGFIDDNYLAVTDNSALPRLQIANASPGVVLTWVTAVPGFVLQENPAPGTPGWVNSTNAVSVSGTTNQVTVSPALGIKLYRLYHP